jgi:hypothetical protein
MAKYRAKHPKGDRADKGKPRPERQHKVADAALVRSLLLKSEPILLEPSEPKSRVIGRASRLIVDITRDLSIGSKREARVRARLRRILGVGIVDKVAFAHGELLTTKWIPRFQKRFGVKSSHELAKKLGLEPRNLWNLGRPTAERALTAKYASKLLRAECGFIAALMQDRGKPAAHFKAVVPDLREKLHAAKKGIDMLRDFRNLPANEQDFTLNDLCAAAPEDAVARTILCWLPELLDWIARHPSSLGRKSKALAVLFLKHDYGIGKVWVVQYAAYNSKVSATDPEVRRALILPVAVAQATRPKGRVIREPKKSIEKTSKYRLAQAVFGLTPKCREAIQNIRGCKKVWPGDRKRWESEARNVGFVDQAQIDILIESKTPEAAAAKIVAILEGLTPRAVQNAWSVHGKSFQ